MSTEPTFPTWRYGWRFVTELDEAEAWAWRCADTMPDTAQGRRDSEADADALRVAMRSMGHSMLGLSPGAGIVQAIHRGRLNVAARRAATWGGVARRACPGLRS